MISPASIAADATLAVATRVSSGHTTDGVRWDAAYVGKFASFHIEGAVCRELITHEQCDALIAVAEQSTIDDVIATARGIS